MPFTTLCILNDAVDEFDGYWRRQGLGWITERAPSKLNNCTNVLCYCGISTYTKEEMSKLIDGLLAECKAVGIDVTPNDLKILLKEN